MSNNDIIVKLALGESVIDEEIALLDNSDLIIKLARGHSITDKDIADELYEICDMEHSCCNSRCPVFVNHELAKNCEHFKDGKSMLIAIRNKQTK